MASHVLYPLARRHTLGGVAQVPSLRRCPSVFSTTQKKTAMHLHHGLAGRRRRDSNPRTGYPAYTLSRGASSPT